MEGFLSVNDMFRELPFETVEEQLQGLMNCDAWSWAVKARRWSDLSASLRADATWMDHDEVWLRPLICVLGEPMLRIGIVIDVFRNVYYISLHASPSRERLYKKFKKGTPKWVRVYGEWIACPGINDALLATAFCITQLRVELGFLECLIKTMRRWFYFGFRNTYMTGKLSLFPSLPRKTSQPFARKSFSTSSQRGSNLRGCARLISASLTLSSTMYALVFCECRKIISSNTS